MWDYHVILLMTTAASSEDPTSQKTYVLDIDSHLPYPCPVETYVEMVFPNHTQWNREILPLFRYVTSFMDMPSLFRQNIISTSVDFFYNFDQA